MRYDGNRKLTVYDPERGTVLWLTKELRFARNCISIRSFLCTILSYMSTFSFPGEAHNFWEFVCVDKGEVTIGAGDAVHTLKREISLSMSRMSFTGSRRPTEH